MAKKIEVFASEAQQGELENFPDVKRGWGITKSKTGGIPPMRWYNAIQKRTDEAINQVAKESINGYAFKDGGVADSQNDWFEHEGNFYYRKSGFPHTVEAGKTPAADGGVWSENNPDGLWVSAGSTSYIINKIAIARDLNVKDSQIIYANDTTTPLDDVKYIYDSSTQTTYVLPKLLGTDETIVSVSGMGLVTSGGSYTLTEALNVNMVGDSVDKLSINYHSKINRALTGDNSKVTTKSIRGDTSAYSSTLAWSSTDITEDSFAGEDVYYRGPCLVKLPSGILYLVTTVMHGGHADPGQTKDLQYDLAVKYSKDNGKTWVGKVAIAQLGSTYQCSDPSLLYDHKLDRLWCFFTACKGLTGLGKSLAGTTKEDLSSQVYFTYAVGESNSWAPPVNITSLIKPQEASFIGLSAGTGFVYPDGGLVLPVVTLVKGNYVTNSLYRDPRSGKFTLTKINSGLTGGEQSLFLLQDGSILSQARGLQVNGIGQQLFFYSYDNMLTWKQDISATIKTTDVKGSLTMLSDYRDDGRPLWAFVAANGLNDKHGDRTNLRVWASTDVSNWGISSADIYTSFIGYTSAVAGSSTELLVGSEAGGYSGIFFHKFDKRYAFGQSYTNTANELTSCNTTNADLLTRSGGIKPNELFYNSSIKSVCVAHDGGWNSLFNFNPVYSMTSSLNTIDVRGISIITVDGVGSLQGLSNGYVGQTVAIISTGSANVATIARLSTSVKPDERFMYDLGGKGTLLVQTNVQQSVIFVKTNYGWVTDIKANT